MAVKDEVLKYALQNAIFYNGKANEKSVLGKLLAEKPELRKDVNKTRKIISEAVKLVNKMPLEEQRKALKEIAPELLEKEVKEQGLPELPNAFDGKVVTRFAPAPTGPLHIGHIVRAAMLSFIYAKRYKGTFVLRLEDTDHKKIQSDYYDMIKEDLDYVDIKWDKFFKSSDYMADYYKIAEQLFEKGLFYVCECSQEKFAGLKKEREECPCITKDWKSRWREMVEGVYDQGQAVVRMKTSMNHKNPALRDPPMLRISEGNHPLVGNKYRVWPLYNFAATIADHLEGVTHIFRAKEHEHNTAVQNLIYDAMEWDKPVVINFGMVYLPGDKSHTRDIKEGIESGLYSGWDDIRLHTLRAFLRRGFVSDTFKELAEISGLSKTDIQLSWANIEGINRKNIDPFADRVMVVIDPVETIVQKGPEIKGLKLDRHPTQDHGQKRIPVNLEKIWLSNEDFKRFRGEVIRLKELCNVSLGKRSVCKGDEIDQKMQKIQWVSEPHVNVEIIKPEGILKGIGEPEMRNLKEGDLVQMERVGFGRVDSIEEGKITIWFSHK